MEGPLRLVAAIGISIFVTVSGVEERVGEIDFKCPEGWRFWGSSCFLMVDQPMEWTDSIDLCESFQANLLQIEDEVENAEMAKWAEMASWDSKFWVKRVADQCFGFWDNDQPPSDIDDESCAAVNTKGRWSVVPCFSRLPFICVKPACIKGTFDCGNSRCISESWVCDGNADCPNNLDEMECGEKCAFRYTNPNVNIDYLNRYGANFDCTFTIIGMPDTHIVGEFTTFRLEEDIDFVDVYVGSQVLSEAKLLESLTGRMDGKKVYSINHIMVLRLTSDNTIHDLGFIFDWTMSDPELSSETIIVSAEAASTSLLSPYYPATPPSGFRREWLVTTADTLVLSVEINQLDMSSGWSLMIYDGMGYNDVMLSAMSVDDLVSPSVYISTSTSVRIVLRGPKDSKNGQGAIIRVKSGCDVRISKNNGLVKSPGYEQGKYPTSVMCSWRLQAPVSAPRNYSIVFQDLELVDDSADSIEVFDGPDDAGTVFKKYMGEMALPPTVQTGQVAYIKFVSSLIRNMGKFSFIFSVDCPAIPDSPFMSRSSNDVSYNSMVEFTCDDGYSFTQEEYYLQATLTFICQLGGTWDQVRFPTCSRIYCGAAPAIDNGHLIATSGDVTFGSTATYECYDGFTMQNSDTVECLGSGMWSTSPVCVSSACPSPPFVSKAERKVITSTAQDNSYGAVLEYTCNEGYEIIGVPRRQCQTNNTWSGNAPICRKIKCPLPMIKHGSLGSVNALDFESNLQVTCENGYVASTNNGSSDQLTCKADGTFDELICLDEDECSRSSPPCTTLTQTCVNTEGSHMCPCKPGYKKSGENCIDIDECGDGTDGCDGTCSNSPPGSYLCFCPSGYKLFKNESSYYHIAPGETGTRARDVYQIDHTCVRVTCDRPEDLMNGVIHSSKNVFQYEEMLTFSCLIGYELSGSAERSCLANTGWTGDQPACLPAKCPAHTRQGTLRQQQAVNNIYPSTEVGFEDKVYIECKKADDSLYNMTRFCAYDRETKTYKLQGDGPECQVVDCGPIPDISGLERPNFQPTNLGDKFTFTCQTGAERKGKSSKENFEVECMANGRWGLGTLTCTAAKCPDPGTPAGTVQTYDSYEQGQTVHYRCTEDGFTLNSASQNLTCVYSSATGKATWDKSAPTCKDTTAPIFPLCLEQQSISIDKMDNPKFAKPFVNDNSGLVTDFTVIPVGFVSSDPLWKDTTVTYTARDGEGNTETCVYAITMKDYTPGSLNCPSVIEYEATDTPMTYNITDELTFSGGELTSFPQVTVTLSDVGTSEDYRVTLRTDVGRETTCAFKVKVVSGGCYTSLLPSVNNAVQVVDDSTDTLKVTLTCQNGFAFANGATERLYSCTGKNSWAPALPMESCIQFTSPEFTYKTSLSLYTEDRLVMDANCRVQFSSRYNSWLSRSNSPINQACDNGDGTAKYQFSVQDAAIVGDIFLISHSVSLTMKLLNWDGSNEATEKCKDYINTNKFEMFKMEDGTCSFLVQTSSVGLATPGLSCDNGYTLTFVGGGQQCLPCEPGTYTGSDGKCVACLDGEYQDEAGRSSCKSCGTDKVSTTPRITLSQCQDKCNIGFKSNSGAPPCVPCPFDTYWKNASTCESCPDGGSTLNVQGATSVAQCRAPCNVGEYSTTGFSPCSACPVNFFQSLTGQTQCQECDSNAITASSGSNAASDCQPQDLSDEACAAICDPTGGICSYKFHRLDCTCKTGYEGAKCADMINHCDSNPCYNSGQCVSELNGYTCTCPKEETCSMTLTADKFKGQLANTINLENTPLEDCQNQCAVPGSTCVALLYDETDSYCQLLSARPDNGQFFASTTYQYYRKDCQDTFFYEGSRCELDKDDDCVGNVCSDEAVCRDLTNNYECVCPLGDIFSKPRCERDQDPCDPLPCKNGGLCNAREDIRYQCTCVPGFTGTDCETDIKECDLNPDGCLYGGNCLDIEDGYRCDCPLGFSGLHCENMFNYCGGNACSNGICLNNYINLTAECVCEHPFVKDSSGQCSRINFCDPDKCHENNTLRCNSLLDSFSCDCKTGYEGSLCQHDVDNCVGNACEHGTCVDGLNTYTCDCDSGWTSTLCNTDVQDCIGKCPLDKATGCEDLTDDYMCVCRPGLTGKDCENDIDECASVPCQHDGECVNGDAQYTCNCKPGWTGTNCETSIDQCQQQSINCLNDGVCYSLATYGFCLCETGIQGDRCEISTDLCTLQPPCTSQGTCSQVGGTAKCDCINNYSGVSCELIKDYCSEETCENGGTCSVLDPRGFFCKCPDGFSGTRCETRRPLCQAGACPSSAICISDDKTEFCECAAGEVLAGSICKDAFSGYDLYFNPALGPAGSKSTTAFRLSGDMTLMFWIGYIRGDRTVYISNVDDTEQYLEFYPDKVKLAVGDEEEETDFMLGNLKTVANHWDHVAVTWSSAGEFKVFINNVQTAEGTTSFNLTLTDSLKMVRIDRYFTGYLSQLTVWRDILDRSTIGSFIDNLNTINNNLELKSSLSTGWYQYVLNPGTRKFVPTNAGPGKALWEIGRPQHHESEGLSDKVLPVLKCPLSDVKKEISDRTIEVINVFTVPNAGDNQVMSTLTDELMMKGRYDIVYAAKNDLGNYAFCRFKAYITGDNMCNPDNFPVTPTTCGDSSLSDFCPNGQSPSVPFPNILTCGSLFSLNLMNPMEPFVPPICGDKGNQKFSAVLTLTYVIENQCVGFTLDSIERQLRYIFVQVVDKEWPNLCSGTCDNMEIVPKCDENTIIVTITFMTLDEKIANKEGTLSLTPDEILRTTAIETDTLISQEFGTLRNTRESVLVILLPSCNDLEAISGDYCVTCGPGSFYNSTTRLCELCPVGTYTDTTSQTVCKACGDKTTLAKGSRRLSDCIVKCPAGQEYNGVACSDCPRDYYQEQEGKDYCDACPLKKRTQGKGTTKANQCFDDCESGTELQEDGTCKECPQGYYRTQSLHDECLQCKDGNTTEGPKTTSASGCFLPPCEAGSYIDESRVCLLCPRGKYQAARWQRMCDDCQPSYTTVDEGANNETLCQFVCPPGQHETPPGSKICTACPPGKYRDNSLEQRFLQCQNCPSEFTTDGTGATNRTTDCVIRVCYAGTRRKVEDNTCESCPIGQYQPEDLQTTCESCGISYTTESEGSINGTTDCKFYCPDGFEVLSEEDETCRMCPRGKFRANNDGFRFVPCQPCTSGMTTDDEGATNSAQCNIKICAAGQVLTPGNQGCEDCEVDTYQPEELPKSTTVCTPCGHKKGTKQKKSTEETQCLPFCVEGQQVSDPDCELCPQGTWNDGSLLNRFLPCTECSDQLYTTPTTGSNSQDKCTLRNCEAGYKIQGTDCEMCGYGNYQPERASAECIECGPDLNTSIANATSEEDCTVSCPPGKQGQDGTCSPCPADTFKNAVGYSICEPCTGDKTSDTARTTCTLTYCDKGNGFTSGTGLCSQCEVGFYKEARGNEECVTCPKNYTTEGKGTASKDGCSKLHCEPGFYAFETEMCTPCPVGYYKNDLGAQNCTKCSSDTTTAEEGATSDAQCTLVVCPPGQYRTESNECSSCARGTYQSMEGADGCETCDEGYNTDSEGSTSVDNCLIVCIPGSYRSARTVCTVCEKGKYQPNSGSTSCEDCTDGFTTAQDGADRESLCFRQCPKGQFRPDSDRTACRECGQGTYQPDSGKTGCISCDPNFNTLAAGSDSANDCMPECASGKYLNVTARTCQECALGTYQPDSGTITQECATCPPGTTTSSTGSTVRANCNLADCEPGYYRQSGTGCQECGQGRYQPLKAQTSCEECNEGYTTQLTVTTATSDASCILDCAEGQEYDPIEKKCNKCKIGKIRDKTLDDFCYNCPDGMSTFLEGALDCIIAPTPSSGQLARHRVFFVVTIVTNCENRNLVIFTITNVYTARIKNKAQRFPGLCRGASCSNLSFDFDRLCQNIGKRRRKRATTDPQQFDISVTDLPEKIADTQSPRSRDGESLIKQALSDLGGAEGDLTAAGITNPTLQSGTTTVVCLEGAIKDATDTCVVCPKGEFHNTTADVCQTCPMNKYQDQTGQTSCTDCPGSSSTRTTGRSASTECLAPCAINNDYCKNDGICQNGICACTEFYTGDDCSIRQTVESNLQWIIIGVCAGIFVLLVSILVIGYFCCRKTPKEKARDHHSVRSPSTGYPDYMQSPFVRGDYLATQGYVQYPNPEFNEAYDFYKSGRGYDR